MTLDHAENVAEQRQHVRAYIELLPGDQLSAVHDLLESMLSPLDRKLALAPIDDEPVTPEDIAAIEASAAAFDAGHSVSMEEILADFGLTMDDFEKMGQTEIQGDLS
jgi:hypothetical protein